MHTLLALAFLSPTAADADRPNVVLINADDLGYGDVGCYGATAVPTPNIDRLAAGGLRFTDGHSPAATCTPSRYALLTGEYAFRKPGTGIAKGDAALVIEPDRTTLATVFKSAGYRTGAVGKWHLGLGPQPSPGESGGPDWNGVIEPGPLELGFDTAFLVPATGDRVPTVYVRDRRVVGLDPLDPIAVSFGTPLPGPTGKDDPDLLTMHPSHGHDRTIVNGISRIGYMTGGTDARWVDGEMADVLAGEAVDFINRTAADAADPAGDGPRPFFLYFSLHDIHVPRVPHPRFVGSTDLGPRGDAVVQADWCVGEILRTLDDLGVADDTLVLFTSDNGPVLDDGYRDDAARRLGTHDPNGPWRGGKYSAFEAGTRVPWVVRWPGRVAAGETSDALISQVDLPATFAALTGSAADLSAAVDSVNVLPALLGTDPSAGRAELVEQSKTLSLRSGDLKYVRPTRGPAVFANTGIESGLSTDPQLYDLAADRGETRNLAADRPADAAALADRLAEIAGR